MVIKADLHLHSCLSPCGDLSMSPSLIVSYLKEKNITLAAVTDHNSCLNNPAFAALCKKENILCLYGMEAQTAEEIHVLCLFSSLEDALAFGTFIYDLLPPFMNVPEKTGDQVYVDEEENILGEVEKYLITSASISIDDLVKEVHKRGGLCIPAHVDRPSFSLSSQFGCITPGGWDAIEIVRLDRDPPLDTLNYPVIFSSDAHYPEHIGRRWTDLEVDEKNIILPSGNVNIEELKKALHKKRVQV